MITFASHIRPFVDEFDHIQRTAITSWDGAVQNCEIMLMGGAHYVGLPSESGMYDLYVTGIDTNEQGTALWPDIIAKAELWAKYSLICIISSDIVLGADFGHALKAIAHVQKPFVVGQRWDIDPGANKDTAILHPPSAIDYIIYRAGTLGEIPPFAVGRTAYDNWMIWAALQWGLTVIDATESITAIHLNHGHPEYAGGKNEMLESSERARNIALATGSGMPQWYGIHHAPYVLQHGRVVERGKVAV